MGKELQEFVGEGEGKRGWGGEMEEICNEERRGGGGGGRMPNNSIVFQPTAGV